MYWQTWRPVDSVQAVLVKVLQALSPGPCTSPYNGIGNNKIAANSHATGFPMDGERRMPVAAGFHGDKRDGLGARARKGKSDDLPDTMQAISLLFVTPFHE